MATISITIGAGETTRVIDALCSYGAYQAAIPDPSPTAQPGDTIPNPVTKAAFARSVVLGVIKDIVRNQERAAALATAASLASPDVT